MTNPLEVAKRLNEAAGAQLRIRAEHLEELACAYFMLTGIDPREVELVEQHLDNKTIWYFQKKPLGIRSEVATDVMVSDFSYGWQDQLVEGGNDQS